MKNIIEVVLFLGLAVGIIACGNDSQAANIDSKIEKEDLTEELKDVADEIEEVVIEKIDSVQVVEEAVAPKVVAKLVSATEKTSETKAKKIAKKKKKKKPAKSPSIVFEKTTYNFGTVDEGELVTYQFFFQNKGKENLVIKNATATCGCTVPSYPKVPIEPEEESYIRISFNTKTKKGAQKPVVKVFTNARKAPYELYLEGNVTPKAAEEAGEKSNTEGGE